MLEPGNSFQAQNPVRHQCMTRLFVTILSPWQPSSNRPYQAFLGALLILHIAGEMRRKSWRGVCVAPIGLKFCASESALWASLMTDSS